MKKKIKPLVAILLSIAMTSCMHSKDEEVKTSRCNSFAKNHNSGEDAILLLSCITYAEEAGKRLNMDSLSDFYKINGLLLTSSAYPASKNIDSAIDAFISTRKNVDFLSKNARRRIFLFKENYNLISEIIYAGIDDDKDKEALILEEKIDKVPEISKIYRRYVGKNRPFSSLSSSEGSTLFIHLAYYLSLLDAPKRNEIVKALL